MNKSGVKLKLDKNGKLRIFLRGGCSIETNHNMPRTHRKGIGPWTIEELKDMARQYPRKSTAINRVLRLHEESP